MSISIKITGGGEPEKVAKALRLVAHQILTLTPEEIEKGVEWQDAILLTEIGEDDESEEVH